MKIIISKLFPPKGYSAISLFGLLISRDKSPSEKTTLHETIHFKQQLEMLFIPFFVWYGLEYLIRLFIYKDHDKAYRNICFEKEAYENSNNKDYLSDRKFWNFIKYI